MELGESASVEIRPVKYGRGENPASLANLKPFEPGNVKVGNAVHSGPMVTPALRRIAEQRVSDIEELYQRKETLRAVDAVAVCMIHDAIQQGMVAIKAREELLDRLDGTVDKAAPAVAVQVNLQFSDGSPA